MKKLLSCLLAITFFATTLPAYAAETTQSAEVLQIVMTFTNRPKIENIYKVNGIANDLRNQPEDGYTLILKNSQGKEISKYTFQNTDFSRFTVNLPLLGASSISLLDKNHIEVDSRQIDINSLKAPQQALPRTTTANQTLWDKIKNFFADIFNFLTGKKAPVQTGTPSSKTQNLQNYQAGVTPNNDFNKIIDKLPFENDFMKVVYVPVGKYINIIITKKPFSDNKNKAVQYFKDQGIKNLCNLNLLITPSDSQIQSTKDLKESDLYVPGCKPLFQ